MGARLGIAVTLELLFFAALLFGAAGTLAWPQAWVYLAIFAGSAAVMGSKLARYDPDLLRERLRFFIQPGQPLWDKLILSSIVLVYLAWLPIMAVDAERYHWSHMPVWLEAAGAAGMAAGMWICYLTYRENTFTAPVVRIQAERSQRVISTGPYAVVRHPLYAGGLIVIVGSALLLGSWWGLLIGLLMILGIAVRAVLEERELRQGLAGYTEYTHRVRYRLVPGVW